MNNPQRSFFDSQFIASPSPLDNMSSAERLSYYDDLAKNPSVDIETKALAENFGPTVTGIISSFAGYSGARLGTLYRSMTSTGEDYRTPVNMEFKKKLPGFDPRMMGEEQAQAGFNPFATEIAEIGDWGSKLGRNNLEGIAEDLMSVPDEHHAWLLTAPSYGDYLDRFDLVRMASPEFASMGNVFGKTAGFAADTASIILMSLALEPLAFVAETPMFINTAQGIARARTADRFGRLSTIAADAAEASRMVSRVSGIGKYAALGLAEETAIKLAKYSIDPTYDPDAGSIVFDATVSMGVGGAIGGFAARSFAADRIEKYARRFAHQIESRPGTVINFRSPFTFTTTNFADSRLIATNVAPVGETVDGIADQAWQFFSTTGLETLPNTRSLNLPILGSTGISNRTEDIGAEMLGAWAPIEGMASSRSLAVLRRETQAARVAKRELDQARQAYEAALTNAQNLRDRGAGGISLAGADDEVRRLRDQLRAAEETEFNAYAQFERADAAAKESMTGVVARDVPTREFSPVVYTSGNSNLLRTILNQAEVASTRGLSGVARMARRVAKDAKTPEELLAARVKGEAVQLDPNALILTNRRGMQRPVSSPAGTTEDGVQMTAETMSSSRTKSSYFDVEVDGQQILSEGGQGRSTGIEIEFDSTTISGNFLDGSEMRNLQNQRGNIAFRYRGNWKNLNKSINSVTVNPWTSAEEAENVRLIMTSRKWKSRTLSDGTVVYTPKGRPRFTAENENFRSAVTGLQSSINSIVAEVSRRGGEVNQEFSRSVARALFAAKNEGLAGKAFEDKVWKTVTRFLPPEVGARIAEARRLGNAPKINNLDASFADLLERQQTLDGLWDLFSTSTRSASPADPSNRSLILQVANEIRDRGVLLDRNEFEVVVEELRRLLEDPPMRTNSKGKEVVDARARLAAVADIINRRVKDKNFKISIPRALEANIKRVAARIQAKARPSAQAAQQGGSTPVATPAAGGGAAPPTPTNPNAPLGGSSTNGALDMQENVPQLTGVDTLGAVQQFFNQAATALRSDNPAARLVAFLAFNARRAMENRQGVNVAQSQTVFEQGTYEMTGFLAYGLTSYRNNYVRFAIGKTPKDKIGLSDSLKAAFGTGKKAKQQEFHKAVVAQLRSGAFDNPNEAVNNAAKEIRKLFNDIHDAASTAGVPGFQKGALLNYFPRLWRWDRISRLGSTAEGRTSLINLLKTSLGGKTGTRQVMTSTGQILDLPDVDEAATVLADRLIALSNDADLAPVLDIEQELSNALENIITGLAAKNASRTPYGRARIILDEQADLLTTVDYLNSGRNGISIADLTVDDIPTVMKKYTVSVFGAMNEKRLIDEFNSQLSHYKILDSNNNPVVVETVEQMLSMVNKIGNIEPTLGGTMDGAVNGALREIISAIRYEPLHRSNRELGSLGRFGESVLGVMLPLGYMSTGGAFGLVAMGETSRIVGTFGLSTVAKQVPTVSEMVSNWKSMDEGPRNFAMMLDQTFHPATDRLRRVLTVQMQNQFDESQNMFKRGLDSTANFFSDVTLLSPVTSFTQQLTAASSLQHFYDVAKKAASRLDDATIRTLGLEPRQYDELIDYVGSNAVTARGDRVVDMRNLNDIRMDNLKVFVDRAIRTRIQDMPTRGDFHKIGFSFLGRLLTQFRAFNLKGIDNFALQNLSRLRRGGPKGQLKVTQEITATLMLAGLIQYARKYMDYESEKENKNFVKADEIAKQFLGLEGFVKGAFTGPSEFFLPIMATDAAWTSFVDDDPLFSPYRYSGLNWYGFPAQSFISKGWDVTKDIWGATAAPMLGLEEMERDVTQGTVHKLRTMLPGQNMIGLKQFFNFAENEIADAYRLPEKQPRRPKIED
jgi:hypothetical protein